MAKVLSYSDVDKAVKEITVTEGAGGPEAVATKTADYSILTTDKNIFCDCTAGNITLTLPNKAGNDGTRFYIKKIDSSNYTVTIVGDGTIEGESSYIIEYQNTAIELILATNWWVN